jgi:hypothetical protein
LSTMQNSGREQKKRDPHCYIFSQLDVLSRERRIREEPRYGEASAHDRFAQMKFLPEHVSVETTVVERSGC